MTKKKKTVKREFSLQVMSPEETLALLESKGIRYELCDTPVPVLANKVSCGKLRGTGDETIDGYYYLPKSAVGLHPLMEITAQGESMIEADILDGDLLVTELGAVPMKKVTDMLEPQGIRLECTPQAIAYLAEEGYDPDFGARPVKRAIQQFVLNDLSKKILADEVDRTKPIVIDDFGDGLIFRN